MHGYLTEASAQVSTIAAWLQLMYIVISIQRLCRRLKCMHTYIPCLIVRRSMADTKGVVVSTSCTTACM